MSNKLKILISTTACICFVLVTNAQNITAYTLGCIGNMGDNTLLYSGSIQLKATDCLSIENGVKAMKISNTGVFKNYCEVEYDKNYMTTLLASPNPISTFTIIKMTEPLYIETDEKVLIQIFNSNGSIISEFNTSLNTLKKGYLVQLNDQPNNGVYFLKASSPAMTFKPLTLFKQR